MLRLAGQVVLRRFAVETARDPADVAAAGQTMEGLVKRVA